MMINLWCMVQLQVCSLHVSPSRISLLQLRILYAWIFFNCDCHDLNLVCNSVSTCFLQQQRLEREKKHKLRQNEIFRYICMLIVHELYVCVWQKGLNYMYFSRHIHFYCICNCWSCKCLMSSNLLWLLINFCVIIVWEQRGTEIRKKKK